MLPPSFLATERRRLLQPLWNSFDETFAPHLDKGVLLAVSGGADSRALMEAAARWPSRNQGRVAIVTVDHGTRLETAKEAAATQARAKVLGFDAYAVTLPPSLARDEASLRLKRYDALWRIATTHGFGAIVTAHHQDDDAEGFWMDLFGLGGGQEGAGILREALRPNGLILRPFLSFSRAQLLSVLNALDANDYFSDPSNDQARARRSQVRQWMPRGLAAFHPNPSARLALVARRRAQEVSALSGAASLLLKTHDEGLMIHFSPDLSPATLRYALKQGLRDLAPNEDLRNASKTFAKVLAHAKKIGADQALGLDQGPYSFTVGAQVGACFDFTKVQAKVTRAGIWLSLKDKNKALPVQSESF